ncbi:MAG TPA: hypothetical protein VEB64_06685 [Azospirillaceae bacterium]|nr:hypothetical protein [Azospirillaceae bacterium]
MGAIVIGAGMMVLALVVPSGAGRADTLTSNGIAAVAPRLSEQLGSVHAGAARCGLANEAQAVAAKHREHLGRMAEIRPGTDTRNLELLFEATSEAYRQASDLECSENQRQEIRHKLPDVFASVDAFDASLTEPR